MDKINIAYYDYPEIIKNAGLNGFTNTEEKPEENNKSVTINFDGLTEAQANFLVEKIKNMDIKIN